MKTVKIPTEVYSRVVGYFRPVNQWNNGKKEEFSQRREYSVSNIASALENSNRELCA